MSKPVIQEVVTDGFRRMVDDLATLSGKLFEDVLIHQVGALLKVCLRMTPAARASAIVKRISSQNDHVQFPSGHIISIWKKAGDVTMFLDESTWDGRGQAPRQAATGMTWHDMSKRRWSDKRWARYQAYQAELKNYQKDPKAALRARGISKQSWEQIAQDLGLDIGAPAFVRRAVPSNGKTYKNGVAKKFLEVAASYIEIANDNYLVVKKLDGWAILQRAMNTRRRAFQIEMEKGVFEDIAMRAKRYPGIFTDSNTYANDL
jgi:hypothetical protein